MLRVYVTCLEWLRLVSVVMEQIARRDANLAEQLRRAATSVPLNVAEGSYSKGKLRMLRYSNAAGSAREAYAAIEVAHALGYVGDIDVEVTNKTRAIIGTLVKCMR